MPHDKKGRLIEVGDHLKFKAWQDGAERITVGRVMSVNAAETCNASVAHLVPGYYPLREALVTAKDSELVLKADGTDPDVAHVAAEAEGASA